MFIYVCVCVCVCVCTRVCVCLTGSLTVHIVDLEQELELVSLAAVDQEVQSFQQLVQTDGAAAVRVKQREETLGKERLHRTHNNTTTHTL